MIMREVFDGVPSQHDGKDATRWSPRLAAVVAGLAGKVSSDLRLPPYQAADRDELAYWVEEMVVQRQIIMPWQGRLEGLLARHCAWKLASQVVKVSSGTLLRILRRYGNPQALAEDADAATQLARWGRSLLSPAKIEELLTARTRKCRCRYCPSVLRQQRRRYPRGIALSRHGHQATARANPPLQLLCAVVLVASSAQRAVARWPTCADGGCARVTHA